MVGCTLENLKKTSIIFFLDFNDNYYFNYFATYNYVTVKYKK